MSLARQLLNDAGRSLVELAAEVERLERALEFERQRVEELNRLLDNYREEPTR